MGGLSIKNSLSKDSMFRKKISPNIVSIKKIKKTRNKHSRLDNLNLQLRKSSSSCEEPVMQSYSQRKIHLYCRTSQTAELLVDLMIEMGFF